jgi:hypothetical protein
MNWLFFPVLALAFAFFRLGLFLAGKIVDCRGRAVLLLGAFALALPAFLYVATYARVFDACAWFYELRAAPGSELLASLSGLLAGLCAGILAERKTLSKTFVALIMAIWLAIPFVKSMISLFPGEEFKDGWRDGVCLQSSCFSCGPASAATLMAQDGVRASEAEIAKACYSYRCGTEAWHLARYLRGRGYDVEFHAGRPGELPPPHSIAGTLVAGRGHFIPIMTVEGDRYLVGDPMIGPEAYSAKDLARAYKFTGFFMKISLRVKKGG